LTPDACSPLCVAVDGRCLNRPEVRGMGKYLTELITVISRSRPCVWRVFMDRPDLPIHLPDVPCATAHAFDWRGHRFYSWEQVGLPIKTRRSGAHLVHCPATSLPWWQPVPTVVTLHDTITWGDSDDAWPRGFYRDRLLPAALRKCHTIITVSENSRKDIIRLWPDMEPKITVIPHGIDERYRTWRPSELPETLQQAGVRRPFLLYVGGDIPRKRPAWALRIFASLGDRDSLLVMCGITPGGRAALRESVPDGLRERVVFLPFVEEGEMAVLYGHAAAVLYPTRYEGFGFPMIEAQAVGTPVLFTPVSSLGELQGPAAIPLPAEDLGAWVSACRSMLAERGSEPRPDEPSRCWAAGFSWDTAASRTVDVYARAAGTGARFLDDAGVR
jgi:glycosyltransferase involved in cell wall biosynthesis